MSLHRNRVRNENLTCPMCSKTFQDKQTLEAHKKMDHGYDADAESPADVR